MDTTRERPKRPASAEPGKPTANGAAGTEPADRAAGRRGRSLPGQGGRLRGDIVAAAERLLAVSEDGDALSLRAVARAAGIAAPSIYLHFPSKDALVRGAVADFFVALSDALRASVVGVDEPGAALLTGCLAYCRFAAERPGAYRALFLTPRTWTPLDPRGHDVGTEAFMVLVDGIAACQEAGLAPPDDPFRLATNVWAALHGIATLRWVQPEFRWPPLADQVRDVLEGLVGVDFGRVAANPT